MAGKKPLSPSRFRSATAKHLKKRPKEMKAKAVTAMVKGRARHYSRGATLIKQVSDTLKKVAATHPNPKAKKQAKLALGKLDEAQCAFGDASLCQGDIWDKSQN